MDFRNISGMFRAPKTMNNSNPIKDARFHHQLDVLRIEVERSSAAF